MIAWRRMGLKAGRIQHIFYIIKENRTYDQVLGDLPQGNGDKSLTIFGRDITPNLHCDRRAVCLPRTTRFAPAKSAATDGDWSTQGMADPYVCGMCRTTIPGAGESSISRAKTTDIPPAAS